MRACDVRRIRRRVRVAQVLLLSPFLVLAARAVHHFRVVKDETESGAVTRVDALDAAARREEVARMLAGKRITEAARAAADSLIRAGVD